MNKRVRRSILPDLFSAIGPLLVAASFAMMLYALLVPVNELVQIAIGLVYWPILAFVSLLVETGLAAFFRVQPPSRWIIFRNGFFPVLLIVSISLVFLAGNWFWLIVFCHCLHLSTDPPDDENFREGCLTSALVCILLLIVGLAAAMGAAVAISESFNFPNTSGDLRYLPGMLILGIAFYLALALVTVLKVWLIERA